MMQGDRHMHTVTSGNVNQRAYQRPSGQKLPSDPEIPLLEKWEI